MAQCLTKFHGEVEYSEDATFHFANGLFGFESETRFLPVEVPAARPIVFLQSLASPGLCFVTLPILVVDQNYRLAVKPEDLAEVELPEDRQPVIGEDVLCLAILTIQKSGPTTANLLAPVMVNLRNRKAVQAISLETGYSHRHIFLEPSRETVCS